LNTPDDATDLGAAAPPQDHASLDDAIERLTGERQQRLEALLSELAQRDRLSEALPDDARAELAIQQRRAREEIVQLLADWQSLGGGLTLTSPQAAAGAVTADALPTGAVAEAEPAAPRPVAPARPLPPREPPPSPHRPPRPEPPTEPAADWAEDLAALLAELSCTTSAHDEMAAVQRAASASFTRWPHYPRSVQRALVGNLACRLRHLQDHLGVTGSSLDSAFRSLTRFSKSFQPGWVNGLTRGRGPAAASWYEEARVWWDQLSLSAAGAAEDPASAGTATQAADRDEALDCVRGWLSEWREAPDVAKPMCLDKTLAAIQSALEAGVPHTDSDLCRLADEIYDHLELSRFRRLRQGIRDLELAQREDQGMEPAEAVPSDWPWWSHTVGRRALLLGPELDTERLPQVESSFGLAELRYRRIEPGDGVPDELERVLRSGGIDLVMLVGEHAGQLHVRAAIRSCQVRGLPWIHVDRTLGVTRVRMAIERFLQPDPRADGGAP